MTKYSGKISTSSARTVFLVLLFLTFAGAVWSLITGNSDLNRAKNEENSALAAGSGAPQTGGASEDNPAAQEDRIIFGQVPQSTDNAQNEETRPAATEISGSGVQASGSDVQTADGTAANETNAAGSQTNESSAAGSQTNESSAAGSRTAETNAASADPGAEELLLVNKTHHLDAKYWPDDLVTVSSYIEGVGDSDTKKMRKVAAEALEKLIAGAAAEGYQIKMRTGFRSYDYQKKLFAGYAEKNGEEAANKYSARAGESEHQSGLCCDVSSPSVSWAISYEYDKTAEGKWLAEHGHEYGFIIRYLPGKEDITGYNAEPWHIRYVGVGPATEIYEKGICFEEYLGITD